VTSVADLSSTIASAAERVGPSVAGLGRGWRTGSGVVVAPNRVLTVAHALRSEETTISLAGEMREARVLATDAAGRALLDAQTGDAPAVTLAEAQPALGDAVVALADPGGRGLRATLGFVSTAERTMRGARGRRVEGAIEHTAPLPRGSSGGPLLDAEARLLGLNAIRLDGGLILAVPVTTAALEALESGEQREPRRLGLALAPPRVARRVRSAAGLPPRDGLLVRGVKEDSPAGRAGLRRGDLVVSVNGSEDDRLDTLHAALESDSPSIELGVVRGTEELAVSVTF
jgi:serine protease Do